MSWNECLLFLILKCLQCWKFVVGVFIVCVGLKYNTVASPAFVSTWIFSVCFTTLACFICLTDLLYEDFALQGFVSPLLLLSSALSGLMCVASLHVLYRRFQASVWVFTILCLPLKALQRHWSSELWTEFRLEWMNL